MNGSPHLSIGQQVRGESRKHMEAVWPPIYEVKGPRYDDLTIRMTECVGLVLMTLPRVEKLPR